MAKADPASKALARVERAAAAMEDARRAEAEYHAAVVAAVEALDRAERPAVFATVAEAAGMSRQGVRQLVERARQATRKPTR